MHMSDAYVWFYFSHETMQRSPFPEIKTELIQIVLILSLSGQRTVTNDNIWNE